MKRLCAFFLLSAALMGCATIKTIRSPLGGGYTLLTSTLHYEQLEQNNWRVFQPREGDWRLEQLYLYMREPGREEWRKYGGMIELPEKYFPLWDVIRFHNGKHANFFYALYPLNADTELAVWVQFLRAFELWKGLPFTITGGVIEEPVEERWGGGGITCQHRATAGVDVTFNAVDVNFDSASLYFIKNGEKVQGIEVANTPVWLSEPEYIKLSGSSLLQYAQAIHTLSSPETIKNRQPLQPPRLPPRRPDEIQNYPTFHYRFALTCADFENIVFVIDGLYYKGERLPPLKVRLHYFDFSKVPQYIGPQPRQTNG